MSNDLVLRRNIHIETWRVQGTILKAQARADILLVLQYVAENPNATAKTEKGKLALQEKEVFIPEDGVWEISFSNDPLLPHTILDFASFDEPDAYQEVSKKNEKKFKERQDRMDFLPKSIRQPHFNAVKPFLNPNQSIWLENIQAKGEKVSSNLQLVLEWNASKQNVRLLKNNKIVHQFAYQHYDQNQIWQILLEQNGWQDDWSGSKNSMAISFAETDEASRQTMKIDLEFKQPDIDDLGEFDDFIAENVAIHAMDKDNAIKWAWWRLEHNINDFADEQTYQKWVEHAQSPFVEYTFRLPERNELANLFWQDEKYSPKSWHLISASDWQI